MPISLPTQVSLRVMCEEISILYSVSGLEQHRNRCC